ncbi:NnrS family protein [Thalassotalea crassostreae]|uniref:NnrS family protein n=1 Tax=Thalassotalea crassostreae TaxID=1763536 RepID=UPI000837C18F|nr:NnrS family protein [Thalassotalea crassostreae]
MQITDLSAENKITPFLRLGFRPFFLLGAIFSILSLMIWGLYLSGYLTIDLYGGGHWWHIHEMFYGFACAIIVGFLLTAVGNWTGQRGLNGNKLLFLVLLWLLGRLVLLFPQIFGSLASAIIDISFMPLAAYFLALPIIKVKNTRNLFFIPIFIVFTVFNIQFHLVAHGSNSLNMLATSYGMMMMVTLVMSVMAGRVTPMFTANGTQTSKVEPIIALEYATNTSIALIALSFFIHPWFSMPEIVLAILFFTAGLTQMLRWLRYKPWITFGVPLLWSLHSALMFIWIGLIALGIAYFSADIAKNHLWHILTIGGMAGLILAMIARVSLGHTGRPLKPAKLMSVAFAFISLAALVRTLGPVLDASRSVTYFNVSILCWTIAFGCFVIIYAPMLTSARKDGRPG